MRRTLLAAACAGAIATTPASAAPPPPASPYQGYVLAHARPRDPAEVERIWTLAEHVLAPHDPELVPHQLAVSRATLARLAALGLDVARAPTSLESFIADSITSALRPPKDAIYDNGKLDIFGPFFSKVQPLEAITSHLAELARLGAGRAEVISLGKSVEGRDIAAMRISNAPRAADRPSVVVVGAQHAREWASPMVAMGLIDALVRQYPTDARVRRVVDHLEIWIVPVGNPDGYVATFNGRRLQRKNMNPKCGVDLNRNYDVAFGAGTPARCAAETYAGDAAFSEPESRAIRALVESLPKPRLLIDYHSTAAQVMIPYAYTTNRPPNYEKNKALCELYSTTLRSVHGTNHPARAGYLLARGAGGGAFDWFRAKYAESIVVELGGGPAFNIAASAIIPAAEENFVAWLAVAEKVVDDNGAPAAPDAAPPPVADAGAPDRPMPPPSPPDAGAPPPPPAPPAAPDAAVDSALPPPSAPPPLPATAQPLDDPNGGPGCSFAGPERSAAGLAWLLVLAALWRRRR